MPFGGARGDGHGGKGTKMVEKGSHHGTWDLPGRDGDGLERLGTRGDENFWITFHFCTLVSNNNDIIPRVRKYNISACSFRQNP